MQSETKIAVGGAIVAVLLQVILAPNIALFGAVPNFLIVYALVVSMTLPTDGMLVMCFCLGLISDLLGYGPVGSLAFLLVLSGFFAGRMYQMFGNGQMIMALITLVVFAFLTNIFYAAFLIGLTSDVSFADAFLYRALPCSLYECVLGLLVYPIMSHLLVDRRATMGSETPSLRLR